MSQISYAGDFVARSSRDLLLTRVQQGCALRTPGPSALLFSGESLQHRLKHRVRYLEILSMKDFCLSFFFVMSGCCFVQNLAASSFEFFIPLFPDVALYPL